MPLLGVGDSNHPITRSKLSAPDPEETLLLEHQPIRTQPIRRQSQHSIVAKAALKNMTALQSTEGRSGEGSAVGKENVFNIIPDGNYRALLAEGPKAPSSSSSSNMSNGVGRALSDTPLSTAPNSPNMSARTSPSM